RKAKHDSPRTKSPDDGNLCRARRLTCVVRCVRTECETSVCSMPMANDRHGVRLRFSRASHNGTIQPIAATVRRTHEQESSIKQERGCAELCTRACLASKRRFKCTYLHTCRAVSEPEAT